MTESERIERGKQSALYRRWIGGEWAEAQSNELELTPEQQAILRKDYQDMTYGQTERFIALCGAYLLDGRLPPALNGRGS